MLTVAQQEPQWNVGCSTCHLAVGLTSLESMRLASVPHNAMSALYNCNHLNATKRSTPGIKALSDKNILRRKKRVWTVEGERLDRRVVGKEDLLTNRLVD